MSRVLLALVLLFIAVSRDAAGVELGDSVLLETNDAKIFIGRIVEHSPESITLQTANGVVVIELAQVQRMTSFTIPGEPRPRASRPPMPALLPVVAFASAGAGIGWQDTDPLLSGGTYFFSVSVDVGTAVLSGRSTRTHEFLRGEPSSGTSQPLPLKHTTESAFLLHFPIVANPDASVSLGAGPSVVRGLRRGRFLYYKEFEIDPDRVHKPIPFHTFGLALEASLHVAPTRNLGVGMSAFANLNAENSFVAGVLSFHLGQLR